MDDANCELAWGLVRKSYISQGQQSLHVHHGRVKTLLSSRRLPQEGWDEATIEMFLQDLSAMDSNNFLGNAGVGEREARVACPLVARRYWNLAHGIGRSGDIAAEQPKAAGSSLLSKLCCLLAADALKIAGMTELVAVTVLPLATGMAMTMTLLALRSLRGPTARYVVWSRIDQKTCLKCIRTANLEPLVVPLILQGDELTTDVGGILKAVEAVGPEQVVCVVTTTSCFAPRGSDNVVAVAKACHTLGVPHMINNAYGVQSAQLCASVSAACRKGRVDAIVQSTDKNFMVPVGGSIVAAPGKAPLALVEAVNQLYPGRAGASTHLDLLLTFLHWGVNGWRQVLSDREQLYPYLKRRLEETAKQVGERVLHTPNNPISIALSLDNLAQQVCPETAAPNRAPAVTTPDGALDGAAETPNPAAETATAETPSRSLIDGPGLPASTADGAAEAFASGNTAAPSATTANASTAATPLAAHSIAAMPKAPAIPSAPAPATCNGPDVTSPISVAIIAEAMTRSMSTASSAPAAHRGHAAKEAVAGGAASRGISKSKGGQAAPSATRTVDLTMLGSMLWSRFVSGTRVVTGTKTQQVAGLSFHAYGAHHDQYPHKYLTVAAALGTTQHDVDKFIERLVKCYHEFKRKQASAGVISGYT